MVFRGKRWMQILVNLKQLPRDLTESNQLLKPKYNVFFL